jgi:hypothetical protein
LKAVGDDEDDPIGYSTSYIDAALAVLPTIEGRLFLVDATRMTVIEEITLRDTGGGYRLDLLFPLPEKKVALVYTQRGPGAQRNSRLCLLARQEV